MDGVLSILARIGWTVASPHSTFIPEVWSDNLAKAMAKNLDHQVLTQIHLMFVPENLHKYIVDVSYIDIMDKDETHIYYHFKNGYTVQLHRHITGDPTNLKEAQAEMVMIADLPHRDLPNDS